MEQILRTFRWKKCFMIGPRSLDIIWGDNPEYWTGTSNHASRFSEVAELRVVSWLEISGNINTQLLSPYTNYSAYVVFNFNEQIYGFEDSGFWSPWWSPHCIFGS